MGPSAVPGGSPQRPGSWRFPAAPAERAIGKSPAQVPGSPGLRGGGSQPWEPAADFLASSLPPPPADAGCVSSGLPRAPCPSPLCNVYTSPSSPPATGTEPAAPTGERRPHCCLPHASPGAGRAPGGRPRPRAVKGLAEAGSECALETEPRVTWSWSASSWSCPLGSREHPLPLAAPRQLQLEILPLPQDPARPSLSQHGLGEVWGGQNLSFFAMGM